MEFNEYQTPVTEELLASLPKEVQEQLLDAVNNIEFVKRLVSPNRPRAKDLPRDEYGRIIVDVTNPHILEDMDYFRPAALYYKKHGVYTHLKPNPNPNSEFQKWFREEINRCWNGYVRESDGEWITGYMYYFLNYSPIMVTQIREGKKSKKADRVKDIPEVWEGIYWRFHCIDQAENGGKYNDFLGGENFAELASRGKGKSYTLASILSKIFTVGENSEAKEDLRGIIIAYLKEYLTKDGAISKFVDMIDHAAETMQFPRRRLKDSLQDLTWIMGYKDTETGTNKGTGNTILGVSAKDDESKIRGKRAAKILIEEFGSFPRLLELYNVLLPSVQEGDISFGQIILVGTAGDNDSDFEGAQEIMYNPKGYSMYTLPNVYDKNNAGKPYFVYFFPGYINRKGCYNKDGVSDVVKGLIEIFMNRYRIKYNSTKSNTLLKAIAEVPITPAEAILKVGVNMFPATDLTERLGQLDSNPDLLDQLYQGDLILTSSGEVEFKINGKKSIREYPIKDNKEEGAIEIIQMPEIDRETGKAYSGRYIGGIDPYDDDSSNTASLGSMFIIDLWTDKIVAEYTGRPMYASDFYEKCRRLALFYNCRVNYENNKKGLFSYFAQHNCLYLLTDQLEFLKDKHMVKPESYGNKVKGTNASAGINSYAKDLLRNWLTRPEVVQKTDDGEEVTTPALYSLMNRALIKELINYNTVNNFDRISAMGMLMLLREDRIISYHGDASHSKDSPRINPLAVDPFFEKNFKSARSY